MHLVYLAIYLSKRHGDLSTLACVGKTRIGQPYYIEITRACGPVGHDGQFYYALAQAPFRQHGDDIDVPAARHLRLLYPTLCWLGSGGDARRLLLVMPILNLLSIGILAGIGAWLALLHGRSPWWGIFLPIGCNAAIALMHNFTDALSTMTVVGLLAAWSIGARGRWVVLWSLLAVFSREQNVVIVALAAAAAGWNNRFRLVAALATVLGLWAAWVLWLHRLYNVWPFLPGQGNVGWLGVGLLYRWTHLGIYCGSESYSPRLALIHAASVAHLFVLLLVAGFLGWRERRTLLGVVTFAGVGLALLGGAYIYRDFWSYTRVFAWLPMGIWFGSLRSGQRPGFLSLAPGVLWPLLGALNYA